MGISQSLQLKTKTTQTGEYLPLTTNVITTINKSYTGASDNDYRLQLSESSYFAGRVLSYVGYNSQTWLPMGTVEEVNSSTIWLPSTNTIAKTGNCKWIMTFSATKIAEDTSFNVVPKDTTVFTSELTSYSVEHHGTALLNMLATSIMEKFGNIYGMNSTEYYNLYGKVQVSNINIKIEL